MKLKLPKPKKLIKQIDQATQNYMETCKADSKCLIEADESGIYAYMYAKGHQPMIIGMPLDEKFVKEIVNKIESTENE